MDRPDEGIDPASANSLPLPIPIARPVGPVSVAAPIPSENSHEFLLRSLTAGVAFKDIVIFCVAFIALMLAGEMLLVSLYDPLVGSTFADEEAREKALKKAVLIPAILWRVLITTVIAFWLTRRRGLSRRALGLTSHRLGINILVGLGAYGVIAFGMIFFSLLIQYLLPNLDREFQRNAGMIKDVIPKISPAAFGLFALAIGFYEELLFRGVLMPRLRRITGSWVLAVLLTTAIFAVLHLGDQAPAALLAVCALSLIFSLVTIWRKSLVPAIIAHALFDWIMFLLLYYPPGVAPK